MNRQDFRSRVEHWRRLLLPEWRLTIIVDATHLDDDVEALMAADEDYNHAEIAFTRGARQQPPADVDVTITHELLHCLTREYRRTFDLLDGHVAPAVLDVLNSRHRSEEERVVDRLSRIIAQVAA